MNDVDNVDVVVGLEPFTIIMSPQAYNIFLVIMIALVVLIIAIIMITVVYIARKQASGNPTPRPPNSKK